MKTLNKSNNLNQINENKLINQPNNLYPPAESSQGTLLNVNTDELNPLTGSNQLGLLNNQQNPNPNQENSNNLLNIQYSLFNTLDSSNFRIVEDPKDVIGDCKNAIIFQPTTYLQMASGCITENEYDVLLDSPQGLVYAFYFKEKSHCCCRNCCRQQQRPFDMYANIVPSGKPYEQRRDNHYFRIERSFGCDHYCCFCNCIRPKMYVYYEKTGQYVGKIIDSCRCCHNMLEIYDSTEKLIYEVGAHCCQLGFCCGRNAETVAKIDFKVFGPENKDGKEEQDPIGHLIKIPSLNDKIGRSMVQSHRGFHDDSNSFIVNFPEGASPDEKFLLVIAAIKLGYQFFTHNTSECCDRCNECCCNCCNYLCFLFRRIINIPCCFCCYCPFCLNFI